MNLDKPRLGVFAVAMGVLGAAGYLVIGQNRDSSLVPVNELRSEDQSTGVPTNRLPWTVWYGGRLECRDAVTVRCQVEGSAEILSILKDGTSVKKGDLVVVLSDKYLREYQGELRRRLARARGQLKAAKAEQARKGLQEKTAWMTVELRRMAGMVERYRIFAPRDGVVFASHVWWRGRAINVRLEPGVNVRDRQPLFQICDVTELRVRAKVLSSNIGKVKVGTSAILRFQGMHDRPLRGKVIGISDKREPAPWPNIDRMVHAVLLSIEGRKTVLIPRLPCEVEFGAK